MRNEITIICLLFLVFFVVVVVVFQCVNSVAVKVKSSRKQQQAILLLVVDKCVTRLTRFVVFATVFWSIFFSLHLDSAPLYFSALLYDIQ